MSKSSWKLPYISNKLFQNRFLENPISNIRRRNSVIPYIFLDKQNKNMHI